MSVRLKASDRTCDSICEQYHSCLEKHVKQDGGALACQDDVLHKCVQKLLSEGNVQVLFSSMSLDPLAVMEASLQSAGSGLQGLAKAFEVLELAAINLYLCPWRKEYKTIKMFSGTYIHLVAPVLSEQQAAVLFGLLGYQVAEGQCRGQQLELRSPPTAEQLRRLACGFFLARCECRLLVAAVGSPGRGVVVEQALVKERQKGCGLQEALNNVKKQETVLDGDIDLYTAEPYNGESQSDKPQERTHRGGGMSLCSSGNTLPAGGSSSRSSVQDEAVTATRSDRLNWTDDPAITPYSQQGAAARSGKTEMSRAGTEQHIASQTTGSNLILYCEVCCILHSLNCPDLELCERQGHCTRHVQENLTHQERAGRAQDPKEQEQPAKYPERHTCLVEARSYAHEPTCEQDQHCSKAEHIVLFEGSLETREHAAPLSLTAHSHTAHSMTPHSRDPSRLTTGVLHSISSSDMKLCMHLQLDVKKCTDTKDCMSLVSAVCEHCRRAYCRMCWFKDPLHCECGQSLSTVKSPLDHS